MSEKMLVCLWKDKTIVVTYTVKLFIYLTNTACHLAIVGYRKLWIDTKQCIVLSQEKTWSDFAVCCGFITNANC